MNTPDPHNRRNGGCEFLKIYIFCIYYIIMFKQIPPKKDSAHNSALCHTWALHKPVQRYSMKVKLSGITHFPTHVVLKSKDKHNNIPDFSAEPGEVCIRYENDKTLIYCGIGEKESCTHRIIRASSAKGVQRASEMKRNEVSLILHEISDNPEATMAALEGTLLGGYRFTKYKSEKPDIVKTIELVGSELSASSVHKIEIICEAVSYARDLVNENASEITPDRFARDAQALARTGVISVTVLDEKELQRKGLNLITAVGQGSPTPPRLIIMEYKGNKKDKKKTALIGKGVTFDSGGQNLKPTGSIETMRCDMAGAAAVLGTMKALVRLKPGINVIGVISAAHNAINGNAFFPGDVYTSYSGKTIEIYSTDAEGRLILADAATYCLKNYKPSEIIDLATLTGGIIVALGDLVAGLFSNDDNLAMQLFEAGEKSGERLWRLPLYKEYSDALKGDLADLRNISKFKKGHASSIIGAAFIKEFIEDTPWAHIDIAGTAFNEGQAKGEIPQFGTGFGVRLLLNYLLK